MNLPRIRVLPAPWGLECSTDCRIGKFCSPLTPLSASCGSLKSGTGVAEVDAQAAVVVDRVAADLVLRAPVGRHDDAGRGIEGDEVGLALGEPADRRRVAPDVHHDAVAVAERAAAVGGRPDAIALDDVVGVALREEDPDPVPGDHVAGARRRSADRQVPGARRAEFRCRWEWPGSPSRRFRSGCPG